MKLSRAIDVARYIIQYSNERNYGVSNLRLQKLLYFVQAASLSLTKDKQPCFCEEIEAWEFGPVVPEVYRKYKCYGNGNIPTSDIYETKSGNIWDAERHVFDKHVLPKWQREIIENVIEQFADCSTTWLVKLTHHQSPWKNAYANGIPFISQESIKEYFCN